MKTFLLTAAAILVVAAIWMLSRESATDGMQTGSSASAVSAVSSGAAAQSSAPTPGRETACGDGADNEQDGLADCDDPDCAGNLSCRCSALSCGDPSVPGSTRTCLPENGCICSGDDGCMACRGAEQTCETTADCCQGSGLTCQGAFEGGTQVKRCMPQSVRLCDIACTNGIWGEPGPCVTATLPPNTDDCEDLVGACSTGARGTVKCRES